MFKQFLLVAFVASSTFPGSFQAYCHDDTGANVAESSVQPGTKVIRPMEGLLDEIVVWLASNFELPATTDRPAIVFVSKTKLATMRAKDRAPSQGVIQEAGINEPAQRRVVALYDNNLKTIFLPDDWVGNSPSDQSILVHEMVHHLQNLARLKFECPMAREKAAYMAQDKWLGQFGMSLETEFEVDMFTVLIASACMY
jgi:hypothetical protein